MTREEACTKAQIIDFQGGYTIALVTEIFNDHENAIKILMKANEEEISRHFNECEKYEAQLKAKENDLEHQDMIIKCLNIDLDNKEKLLKAKDEEIEGLKAELNSAFIRDFKSIKMGSNGKHATWKMLKENK